MKTIHSCVENHNKIMEGQIAIVSTENYPNWFPINSELTAHYSIFVFGLLAINELKSLTFKT